MTNQEVVNELKLIRARTNDWYGRQERALEIAIEELADVGAIYRRMFGRLKEMSRSELIEWHTEYGEMFKECSDIIHAALGDDPEKWEAWHKTREEREDR